MTKLVQMQRFFIGLKKRMNRKNYSNGIRDIIKKKCHITKPPGEKSEEIGGE